MDSLEILDEIGPGNLSAIRSVRLVLKWDDVDSQELDHYIHCNDLDILGNFIDFHRVYRATVGTLFSIWNYKAWTLFKLELERLTLDFDNAYAPDGEFLGLMFARNAQKFEYGIPQDLKIIAPSQTLANGIDYIIREINR